MHADSNASRKRKLCIDQKRWQGRKGWVRETYFLTGIRPSGLSCSFSRVYLRWTEHTPYTTCNQQFVWEMYLFKLNFCVCLLEFTCVTDVHLCNHLPCLWASVHIQITQHASMWWNAYLCHPVADRMCTVLCAHHESLAVLTWQVRIVANPWKSCQWQHRPIQQQHRQPEL